MFLPWRLSPAVIAPMLLSSAIANAQEHLRAEGLLRPFASQITDRRRADEGGEVGRRADLRRSGGHVKVAVVIPAGEAEHLWS